MNLLIELIRGTTTTGGGEKLELIDSEPGNSLENALYVMTDAVEKKLPETVVYHPKATQPYSAKIAAYDKTLTETYWEAVGEVYGTPYPLPATTAQIKFDGTDPSIYIPGAGGWWTTEGKKYQLEVAIDPSTGNKDELKHIEEHSYYLQIRPAAVVGDCSFEVSTDAISNQGDADVKSRLKGVTLFLSHTRSMVLSVRGHDGDQYETFRGTPSLTDPDLNIWTYDHQPELNEDGSLATVYFRFIGDPVHIRAVTLLTEDETNAPSAIARRGDCDPFPTPPAVWDKSALGDLESYGADWEMEMAQRRCLLDKMTGDKSAHEFFFELDAKSSPESKYGRKYAWLGALLSTIYMERASIFDETGEGKLPTSKDELVAIEDHVERAASLVRGTLENHFGSDSKIDLDAVDDAFMRFARGDLAIFDIHGAPNGVNMFAFAELARLCVILELDATLWQRLFQIFARSCEVFVRSYHKFESASRTICAYRVENNPDGLRGPTASDKNKLGHDWKAPDPEERFSQLVHAALFDETAKKSTPSIPLDDFPPT